MPFSIMQPIRIAESDKAGNILATYIEEEDEEDEEQKEKKKKKKKNKGTPDDRGTTTRIDVISPLQPKGTLETVFDVFLPEGYPHSVTDDYIQYQIFDSLQAFASSIAGLLASRAVLEGVGVGDASASPTAALLLTILQESMGRLATILFAHRLGPSLEPECKMYRLLADIFNDAAMVLDCVSPGFPRPIRVLILSCSSVLRALCGVAAGSAKASLSAHFARWGNLGELNAKDSSQETVISLLGMLVGSLVVSYVTSPLATWLTLLGLLAAHLATNYAAVRAVSMHTLNRQRATLLLSYKITYGTILTPQQVSRQERIFQDSGVMRDAKGRPLGRCEIGVPLAKLLKILGKAHHTSGSIYIPKHGLSELLKPFPEERFAVHWNGSSKAAWILLQSTSNARDQLKAWYHVLLGMHNLARGESPATMLVQQNKPEESWTVIERELQQAGWDMDTEALETRSAHRFALVKE